MVVASMEAGGGDGPRCRTVQGGMRDTIGGELQDKLRGVLILATWVSLVLYVNLVEFPLLW